MRDFLTGFLQGFQKSGGVQRLSNWSAKKAGTYDVFEDPFAMQKYQQARQLGTDAAQQQFTNEYGKYVEPNEGHTASEMFFGKEDPTYMGMNKGQFMNTAVQALNSGAWDEGEFKNIMAGASEAYGEDFSNNPFLSAFMQEQPDMKTQFFNDPTTQAAFQGNEFAQNMVANEYGDYLSNFVDVPNEFVNPQERTSFIKNNVFPGENNTLTDREIMSSNNIRQLSPEQVQQYEAEGYSLQQVPGREGYYAIKQPILPQNEGYNYSQLGPEQLAAMVMADEQLTPDEQKIWNNSPYGKFGGPESFMPQAEQQTMVDLGEFGLPGGQIPLSEAGQMMNILNTSLNYRRSMQPTGSNPDGTGGDKGRDVFSILGLDSDNWVYEGLSNSNQPVYKARYGEGLITIGQDEQGQLQYGYYSGPVNNQREQADLGSIITYDQEGNPIYRHPETGMAVYKDGSTFMINGQPQRIIEDEFADTGFTFKPVENFLEVQPDPTQPPPEGGQQDGGGFIQGLINLWNNSNAGQNVNEALRDTGNALGFEAESGNGVNNTNAQSVTEAYANTYNMDETELLRNLEANRNNEEFARSFEAANGITIEDMIDYLNGVN